MSKPPGFARQCLECGDRVGGWVDTPDLPLEVDPALVPLCSLTRKRTPGTLGGSGNSKRRAFSKFLRSSKWKSQRERVLARDGYRCKVRLPGCEGIARQAHHTRYADPIERTPDSDVVASCGSCNLEERRLRITGGVFGDE